MLVAEIIFGSRTGNADRDAEAKDKTEGYLAALIRNGQIYEHTVVGWVGRELRATVYVPRPDSLDDGYASEWVRSEREIVQSVFGRSPQWRVCDDDRDRPYPDLRAERALYLYTDFLSIESPIRAGSDGTPMPTYLFRPSHQLNDGIGFWAAACRALESIEIGCGELEMPAYKQLASPASELARHGRGICSEIEAISGLPTYYYLKRYWGRRKGEEERSCPSCGESWATHHGNPDSRGLDWFDFLCEACRLVSHLADVNDDERHSRIGEYKGKRS